MKFGTYDIMSSVLSCDFLKFNVCSDNYRVTVFFLTFLSKFIKLTDTMIHKTHVNVLITLNDQKV